MSSQSTINSALVSDSDNKRYEQELVKRRQEAETRLQVEEKQQQVEQRARKEARAAEKRRQEEELKRRAEKERRQKEKVERQMKAEEEQRRQKETNDAFRREADRQVAVVQVQRKNWLKKMNLEPLASPLFEKEINLINLPPLTKKQWVHYLPKETLEQCQAREEMAKELGIEPMGGENPYKRCANFGILYLPQDLP